MMAIETSTLISSDTEGDVGEPLAAGMPKTRVSAECRRSSTLRGQRHGRTQVLFNGPLELLRRQALRNSRHENNTIVCDS